MNLNTAAPYIPVIFYLLVVTGSQMARKTIPRWFHLVAVATGLISQAVLVGALYAGLGALAGSLFFLLSVYVAGGHLTRSGIIVYSITFAIAPFPNAWVGLLLGIFLAAFISLIVIGRKMGRDKAIFTVYQSASSLGITGGVIPGRVDPEKIPALKVNPELGDNQQSAGNMRLAPFMLIGISVSMIVKIFG